MSRSHLCGPIARWMVGTSVGRQHLSRIAQLSEDGDKDGAFTSSLLEANLIARHAGLIHQSKAEYSSSRRQLRRSVGHMLGADVQVGTLHTKQHHVSHILEHNHHPTQPPLTRRMSMLTSFHISAHITGNTVSTACSSYEMKLITSRHRFARSSYDL